VAYSFGWLVANLSIRVYNNLVLPLFLYFLSWLCLVGGVLLYLAIIQRLYRQVYDLAHFVAYLLIMAAAMGARIGLYLILEEHDLRPDAETSLFLIATARAFAPPVQGWGFSSR
jgi:hypothetical protein